MDLILITGVLTVLNCTCSAESRFGIEFFWLICCDAEGLKRTVLRCTSGLAVGMFLFEPNAWSLPGFGMQQEQLDDVTFLTCARRRHHQVHIEK